MNQPVDVNAVAAPNAASLSPFKIAVESAKQWLAELYDDQALTNVGLEEIEQDDESSGGWKVTLGFSRALDHDGGNLLANALRARRVYKVVRLANDGRTLISIKDRES